MSSKSRSRIIKVDALARVELDENGDGRPDLWNFYAASGELIRQEQDGNADGELDAWVEGPSRTVPAEPLLAGEYHICGETNYA